jgi:hypothetical protein
MQLCDLLNVKCLDEIKTETFCAMDDVGEGEPHRVIDVSGWSRGYRPLTYTNHNRRFLIFLTVLLKLEIR